VVPRWFGLLGLGMGGSFAIAATARSAEFAALVTLYSRPLDETDVARMQAPILALYAEGDPDTPPELITRFQQMLSQYFIHHELKVYPGLTHDFFDIACPEVYDEAAARDAWEKALLWVRTHLG
jgi:carboxymethylenebutenolidase